MNKMKYITLILFLFSLQAFSASQDPTELLIKPYKVAVSTSQLCTNLQTVYNESSPSYIDFLTSPTIGSGQLADATYPCIVIEMSSQIKYKPTTTQNNCVSTTEYTLNVCQNTQQSTLIDGSSVTCDGTSDTRIAIYISTGSTWTTGAGDPFLPPVSIGDANRGIQLTSALVVDGTSAAKFVVNGTGKIDDSTSCEMLPPVFGFVKL
jgi:hypothetical protein